MAQTAQDVCWLYYGHHLNHNILDDCLMKCKPKHTVFQTPRIQREFPRYGRTDLLVRDAPHSLQCPVQPIAMPLQQMPFAHSMMLWPALLLLLGAGAALYWMR